MDGRDRRRRSRPLRARARPARGGRALQRRVRRAATPSSRSTPGTGGTDAQDWTEMLLRMYLRWAADARLPDRAARGEPGGGGRPQVGHVHGRGRERLRRSLKAERGVHRLVRLSPFDSAHRRHTSFAAGDRRAAPPRRRRRRDRRGRPADRHLPRAGRRRPAREQDRLAPSGSRTSRPGSSSSARTSARSRRTSRRRCASSSSRLVELAEEEREAELAQERGAAQDIGFGSQIRSYVLHPVPARQGPPHRPRGRERAGRPRRRPRRVHPRLPAREGGRDSSCSPSDDVGYTAAFATNRRARCD